MFRFPQITIFIAPVGTVYDFFWPVKIFPLWKLGPESRGGILTTIEGQQTPLRLAGIIFMFCISLQANQHLLVFGNGFNLDDLHCHLFHEVQEANLNQYEERDINNYDDLNNGACDVTSDECSLDY